MANREPVGGFILAGGRSSRMGRAKGLLPFGGEPLVVHAARLLEFVSEPRIMPIIIGPPEVYAHLGIRVVPDDGENLGPLGGISTALRVATCEWNLIVGCDLPFLTREWLEFLIARAAGSSVDVVIPLNERGFEPLCAMYRKSARRAIAEALEHGVRKITDGLAGLTLASIAPAEWKAFDPCGRLFKNVNTPEDYDEARESLGEKTAS
ncbi:MAG TPA: molybdenum cofactor guanylyltransferase [Candidatus Acidoferrales bacterium]|nr:molybdenum cofactor guanylyltransferase [Candidatus Acidoferrales bacterium]